MAWRRFSPVLLIAGVTAGLLAPAAPTVAYHSPHVLPLGYDVQAVNPPTPVADQQFGDGVVNLGDVDGDGEDDILVGLPKGGRFSGKVWVFSGDDGSLIHEIPPPDPEEHVAGSVNNGDGFGTYVGRIADIGSCAGFILVPGDDCPNPADQIDDPDDVNDILASAIGVDAVAGTGDDMGVVYVIDGATAAVLYRIRMPLLDRQTQAENEPDADVGPGFGRAVLSPAGNAPCEGFMGFGACKYGLSSAVGMGDIDGLGKPDIVVGAPDFTETSTTNPGCGADECFEAGRVYVYSGESLEGDVPAVPEEAPLFTIKNPHPQAGATQFGDSLSPVGDLGSCLDAPPPAPGAACLAPDNVAADGRPEFVASIPRLDVGGQVDVGRALLIDGATGAILDTYDHPHPQATALFGFSAYNQPAIGDVGSTDIPDAFLGAIGQDLDKTDQGRGYVMNGLFAGADMISVLDDPTGNKIGNLGTSSIGLGDLTGDSRKEVAIGQFGPHTGPSDIVTDVTIYNPVTDEPLQTLVDPAQQENSGFGRALAPMGDLNDDQFMDFAIGAGKFDGAQINQGRVWIFRSNNAEPECPGHLGDARNDVIGTSGDDHNLTGTNGKDIICAKAGDDIAEALGGADLVKLGTGDDIGRGGSGADVVRGQPGDDTLRGGSGADVLKGGPGGDDIKGQGGNDTLRGGPGPDILNGGSGIDDCVGGGGKDILQNCE